MRTKLWLAACTAVMLGLTGCGDKTDSEANNGHPHGGPGGGMGPGGMGPGGMGPGGGAGRGPGAGIGGGPSIPGSTASYTPAPLDTKYVVPSFSWAVVIHPERIGLSQFLQPYNLRQRPELQGIQQQMGFNPLDIKRAMLLTGIDSQQAVGGVPLTYGVVVNFGSDVKEALSQRITEGMQGVTPETKTHAGTEYTLAMLPMQDGTEPMPFGWFFPDGQTLVAGTEGALKSMIDGGSGSPLADQLKAAELNADLIIAGHASEGDAAAIAKAKETLAQQGGDVAQLMPLLEQLETYSKNVDQAVVAVDISGTVGASLLKMSAEMKSEKDATDLAEAANGGIAFGKLMFTQNKEAVKGGLAMVSGANADAHMQVLEALIAGISVQQSGKTINVDIKTPDGLVPMVNQLVPTLMQLQAGGGAAPGPGFGPAGAVPSGSGGFATPPPQ